MSRHIGRRLVDPDHHGGWSGRLAACEFGANNPKLFLLGPAAAFVAQRPFTV